MVVIWVEPIFYELRAASDQENATDDTCNTQSTGVRKRFTQPHQTKQ